MRTLASGVSRTDTREILQSATYGLGYRSKFGPFDLTDADAAYELLSTVDDPLVVSSFLSVYSSSLGLVARYDDALRSPRSFSLRPVRYRLDFAIPYALTSSAIAVAGLRRWKQAEDFASRALEQHKGLETLRGSSMHSRSTCEYWLNNDGSRPRSLLTRHRFRACVSGGTRRIDLVSRPGACIRRQNRRSSTDLRRRAWFNSCDITGGARLSR